MENIPFYLPMHPNTVHLMSATKQKYRYLQIVIIESIDILSIATNNTTRGRMCWPGEIFIPHPICKLLISNNMVSREIWINMHE
jgi:hypothetical protein